MVVETGENLRRGDRLPMNQARLYGGKKALIWTAVVPAIMALGYLFLILYFRFQGGYTAQVLTGHKAEDEKFTGGVPAPPTCDSMVPPNSTQPPAKTGGWVLWQIVCCVFACLLL